MRRHLCWLAVVALVSGTLPVQAQIKNPAKLFPKNAAFYAELLKPGELAKEKRALFRGSVLYNVPQSLEKLRAKYDKGNPNWMNMYIGMFGAMLAPEMVREAGRLDGVAGAFLGIGKEKQPEYLIVVLPGRHTLPAIYYRMFASSVARPIGKVEGISLYRVSLPQFEGREKFDDKDFDRKKPIDSDRTGEEKGFKGKGIGRPPRFKSVPTGPAVAKVAGVYLIGSPNAIKAAIRRAKGKSDAPSLAESKQFQKLRREIGAQPGVFAYGSAKMFETIEQMSQLANDHSGMTRKLMKLVNIKAFRGYAANLSLKNGTLRYQERTLLDPAEKSPLIELFTGSKLNAQLLHFVPKDAVVVAGASNGGDVKRWQRLMGLLEEAFPVPNGRISDHVKMLEGKLKLDIGKDVYGKVRNVVFAMGNPLTAPVQQIEIKRKFSTMRSTHPQLPMVLVLQTADLASAKKLEAALPTLCNMMASNKVPITLKKIKGQMVSAAKFRPGYSLHFGRTGDTLVLGPYAGPVAQAMSNGAGKGGLYANQQVVERIKAFSSPSSLFLVKPTTMLVGGMMMGMSRSESTTDKAKLGGPVGGDKPKITVKIIKGSPHERKMKMRLNNVLSKESFFAMGVTFTKDAIIEDGSVPNLQQTVPRITNLLVEMAMQLHQNRSTFPRVTDRPPARTKAPDRKR